MPSLTGGHFSWGQRPRSDLVFAKAPPLGLNKLTTVANSLAGDRKGAAAKYTKIYQGRRGEGVRKELLKLKKNFLPETMEITSLYI